jgi:hypothetical protein
MTDKSNEITALIDRAAKAHDSCDALRFSQAACNAANAMCSLHTAQGMDQGRTVAIDIKALTDRFLAWRLPQSVCSDTCVSDQDYKLPRSGTNLLTADEAKQMLEYLFEPAI